MGITHFDEAPSRVYELGHLNGRWTLLGDGAGSVNVGARRIELPAGSWSTPAHDHGAAEEIFYVISGRGLSWHNGETAEIRAGDCMVYLARHGPHTLHALEPLDVVAFGPRIYDEAIRFPRLGMSLIGGRLAETTPGLLDGTAAHYIHESGLGPPELPPSPGARPSTIVNLDAVEPETLARPRIVRTRRNLAAAAGSVRTGLQHCEVAPGKESGLQHCHSLEEELFVILGGDGELLLGDGETHLGPGHVVSRPAGTGVAHVFRAGPDGLTYLAYGTREPADVCYYPRSRKIAFRGVGVIARLEQLDYYDGED